MAGDKAIGLSQETTDLLDGLDARRAQLAMEFKQADHAFHQAIYVAMRASGLTDGEIRAGKWMLDMGQKPFTFKPVQHNVPPAEEGKNGKQRKQSDGDSSESKDSGAGGAGDR